MALASLAATSSNVDTTDSGRHHLLVDFVVTHAAPPEVLTDNAGVHWALL